MVNNNITYTTNHSTPVNSHPRAWLKVIWNGFTQSQPILNFSYTALVYYLSEKVPCFIDGKSWNYNIVNHFASKYSKLYNTHNSSEETLKITESLNIDNDDLYEIE